MLAGRTVKARIMSPNSRKKDLLEKEYGNAQKYVSTEKIKAQHQGQTYSQKDVDKAIKQAKIYLNKCVKPVLRKNDILTND